MKYDIGIIGGGIVGAATFYKIQKAFPSLKVILFEKEERLASHQTGKQFWSNSFRVILQTWFFES